MSAPAPAPSILEGREPRVATGPFEVSDPAASWYVVEGRLDVFSVPQGSGATGGPRRFLFSADAGELVLGQEDLHDRAYPISMVAVPIGGTRVVDFPTDLLDGWAQTTEGESAATAWLGDVIGAIGEAVLAHVAPRIHLSLGPGDSGVVEAGQRASSVHGVVGWVRVDEGRVVVGNEERVALVPGSAPFPLSEGLWVTATEDSRLTALPTADAVRDGHLLAGMGLLRAYFAEWAADSAAQEEVEERDRQAAKSELDRMSRFQGLRALGEVLGHFGDDVAAPPAPGDELLTAMRIAGESDGLTFVQAPEWERTAKRNDPLQAICRASRVRSRQIGLRGDWWNHDAGNLLVFTKGAERHPVALLWKGHHYELVSPVDATRSVVDEAAADALEPLGFMFYTPYPDRPLTGRDLLAIAYSGVRSEVWTLMGIGLATACIALIVPWATDKMLSDVVPVASYDGALVLTLALIAVQVGAAVFDAAKAFVLVRIEGLTNANLQAGLVDRLLSLPAKFYRQFTVGDLANRASGINAVRDLLSGAAGTTLLAGIFSLVFLVQMWWYSWRLTVLAIVVMVLAMGLATYLVSRSVKWQRIQQDMAGKLSGFTVELIGAIPKLRVAAAEDRAFAQWSTRFRTQKDAAREAGYNDVALQVFTTVLPLLASLSLFYYAGWMTGEGKEYALDPGEFVAYNAAFGMFFVAIVNLTNTMVTVLVAIPMLERASPILTAEPEVRDDRSDPGELTGAIEASHVTFRYRADGPIILDDVSFKAGPGDFVAFVGPSGSGKSTCLRMLLGFEEPESGAIYYDQQDLDTLDLTAVRSQIGVVLQTSRLSQGDIYQNIVGSAPLSLDEAWEAADAAGLGDDIGEMPMQMHTVVSEGGSTLSGGQRQRLMIARALVRKPRVIFFDEATSALDNRTQELVSQSLEKTNATRIVIAHRLSTIRNADMIYVMDRGRVVQSGSFDELAGVPGMFQDLVARQLE